MSLLGRYRKWIGRGHARLSGTTLQASNVLTLFLRQIVLAELIIE